MAAQTPPTTEECAAILGRVDGSLRLWRTERNGALADACDAIALLMVHLDVTTIPVPLCSELYASPIDAAEDVALVRDTLADRAGAGYRRDSIRAAAGLLRHALRAYVAPPLSDLSTSHADVSAHDGEAVRAARGA
jgi:hypothetical protein